MSSTAAPRDRDATAPARFIWTIEHFKHLPPCPEDPTIDERICEILNAYDPVAEAHAAGLATAARDRRGDRASAGGKGMRILTADGANIECPARLLAASTVLSTASECPADSGAPPLVPVCASNLLLAEEVLSGARNVALPKDPAEALVQLARLVAIAEFLDAPELERRSAILADGCSDDDAIARAATTPPDVPPLRGLVLLALASPPVAYLAHRRACKLSRRLLDEVPADERARRLFPSLAALGYHAPPDLAPHVLGGRPVASWEGAPRRELLINDDATHAVCIDYATCAFALRRVLDGIVADSGRAPFSTTALGVAPSRPEVVFGLGDGRLARFRGGALTFYPPYIPSLGSEVRIVRYLGPELVAATRGARATIEAIDLRDGSVLDRLGPIAGIVTAIGRAEGLPPAAHVETSGQAFAWRPRSATPRSGEHEMVRPPSPVPCPPLPAVRVGPWSWTPQTARLVHHPPDGPAQILRSVCGVISLSPVPGGRVIVRCRRETFVWDPDGNRVASVATVRRSSLVAPRPIPFLDSAVEHRYVLFDAREGEGEGGLWRVLDPRSGAWCAPERPDGALGREDLFEALSLPRHVRAVPSPSGEIVALVRTPPQGPASTRRPPGPRHVRGVTVLFPGAARPRPPLELRAPAGWRATSLGPPAGEVRFTPDERGLVVPCGGGVAVYAVG
eukprot:tig00000042_g15666.t1